MLNLHDQEICWARRCVVVGATTGAVRGSLVVDLGLRQVTFIATGGVLTPDTYIVTLKSGVNSSVAARSVQAGLTFPSAGKSILTISSPVGFAAASGSLTVGSFTARVPDNAPYGGKHILDITALHVYDDAADPAEIPSVDDDAIHLAAYFGNTNGSGTYNAPDTTLVQRIIGEMNTGLVAYQLADPRLVADAARSNMLANNVTSIQRVIGEVFVPNVPALPIGLPPPAGAGAQLYIPQDLTGVIGEASTYR